MRDQYRKVMALEAVASRFEEELLAGQSPRIESFLDTHPPEDRPALLRELLAIELEVLRQSGSNPQLDQYLERFSDYQADIDTCFREEDTVEAHEDITAVATPASFELADKLPEIPGYKVRQKIGEGGMGVVYRADQISPHRVVALKMIRSASLAGQREHKRFRIETAAVAKLDHPNIVPLLEVGDFEGLPFLTMPFVEGETLTDRIATSTMRSRDAAEMLCQLSEAAQHAHDAGLVHRDIKPANVLVTPSGSPRLTDFGLASEINAESQLTGTGELLGTPSFMAPEQASGSATGIPADIYALGAVLYFVLTGRPPYQGNSPLDTMNRVLNEELLPPRSIDPKIARDLETICLKCLKREAQDRYASAADLNADLRRFLAGSAVEARPDGPLRKTVRWCRRSPWRAAAVVLTVVSVVGILGGIAGFAEYRRVAANNVLQESRNAKAFADRERAELLVALQQRILFERTENHRRDGDTVQAQETIHQISAPTVQRRLIQQELSKPTRQFIELKRLLCGDWPIVCTAWSPDKSQLLIGDHGGQLRFVDIESGDLKNLDPGYVDSQSGMVRHWITNQRAKADNKVKGSLYTAVHWVRPNVAFAATLAGKVVKFDPTADEVADFETVTDLKQATFCLGIGPKDQLLAGTAGGHIIAIDTEGDSEPRLKVSDSAISAVQFNKPHKRWIVGTDDGQILAVNDEATEVIARTKLSNRVWDISVSPAGLIGVALREEAPAILLLANDRLVQQQRLTLPSAEAANVHAIRFTDDNSVCASGPLNRVIVWRNGVAYARWTSTTSDTRLSGSLQASLPLPMQRNAAAIDREAIDTFGLTDHTGQYRRLSLIEPAKSEWIRRPDDLQLGPSPDITFGSSDRYLWSLSSEGVLKLTDTREEKILDSKAAHTPQPLEHIAENTGAEQTARRSEIRISNAVVATVARSKEIKFWTRNEDRIVPAQLESITHDEPILSIDLSDAANLIAAVDGRANLLLWDLATGRKLVEQMIPGAVNATCPSFGSVRFNADGTLVVVTGPQQDTRVFDTQKKLLTDRYIEVSGNGAIELEWSRDCDLVIALEDALHRLHYTDKRRERLLNKTRSLRDVVGKDRKHMRLCDTDFVDGSGFLSLYSNGEIAFHSSKHFLETGTWQLPDAIECHSVAVDDDQKRLAVTETDGSLTLVTLEQKSSTPGDTPLQLLPVTLNKVHSAESPTLYVKWDIDPKGKPYGLTLSMTSKPQEGGRLFYFETDGKNWKAEPLEVEPNDRWPVFGGTGTGLWKNSDRTEVLYRRRRPDIAQYSFDTILATKKNKGATWTFERVIKNANAGQRLTPFRDTNGLLQSIAHHSPAGYQTLISTRGDQGPNGWPIVKVRPHEFTLGNVRVGDYVHLLLHTKRYARGSEEIPRYGIWNGNETIVEHPLPRGTSDAKLHTLPNGQPLVQIVWLDHRRNCGWYTWDGKTFQKYREDFGDAAETYTVLPNGEIAVVKTEGDRPIELRTASRRYEIQLKNKLENEPVHRQFHIDQSGNLHVVLVTRVDDQHTFQYGQTEVDWPERE